MYTIFSLWPPSAVYFNEIEIEVNDQIMMFVGEHTFGHQGSVRLEPKGQFEVRRAGPYVFLCEIEF